MIGIGFCLGFDLGGSMRTQYTDPISLDQLRVICKIAKRSARYLVENGIIPAVDTGRKTWRHQIAIDDVIAYSTLT